MLKQTEFYESQIVHIEKLSAKAAQFGRLQLKDMGISEQVIDALDIEKLYSHQSEAISALLNGQNVVISTSTSSGKSMVYNIPVVNSLLNDPQTTAFYLFPTKALAQDQLRGLGTFLTRSRLEPTLAVTYV